MATVIAWPNFWLKIIIKKTTIAVTINVNEAAHYINAGKMAQQAVLLSPCGKKPCTARLQTAFLRASL